MASCGVDPAGGCHGGADAVFPDPVRQGDRLYHRSGESGFYGMAGKRGPVLAGKKDGGGDLIDGSGAVADECLQ